jgi:hypothetical protein
MTYEVSEVLAEGQGNHRVTLGLSFAALARSMLRSSNHSIARAWRNEVISSDHWSQDPAVAAQPGEAGGFRVTSNSGIAGYLKPTKQCDALNPRAANEKIVADLAWEVDVAVAPVVLFRREPCPDDQEPRACVSLVLWPENWVLEQLMQITLSGPADALVRGAVARSCGIIALDTWAGNVDRSNPRNATVGIDNNNPATAGFAYIDHSYSLNFGGQWDTPAKRATVVVPAMPNLLRQAVDRGVLREAIGRVELVTDSVIEEIVGRITPDYMEDLHRQIVVTGLKDRRPLIRPILATTFGL